MSIRIRWLDMLECLQVESKHSRPTKVQALLSNWTNYSECLEHKTPNVAATALHLFPFLPGKTSNLTMGLPKSVPAQIWDSVSGIPTQHEIWQFKIQQTRVPLLTFVLPSPTPQKPHYHPVVALILAHLLPASFGPRAWLVQGQSHYCTFNWVL